MVKFYLSLAAVLICLHGSTQTVVELQETARNFLRSGDYDNAILVLKKAASLEPGNVLVTKDLATGLYLARQYKAAGDLLAPLTERADADEQVFQMACLAQRGQLNFKETERLYKLALKRFPSSGLLYAEYGDLLESKDPGLGKGIELWEKGIAEDPEFPANYYYACKYYQLGNNLLWCVLYGELFANLESYTARTTEVKNLLVGAYKKLFAYGVAAIKGKNVFEQSVVDLWQQNASLTGTGITPEVLAALRTRFVLGWFNGRAAAAYPFKLFSLHQQLLRQGMFDSYNQWLFGPAANMQAYQNWTASHDTEYQAFSQFQRNRLFKPAKGEYYVK
jgi:hypothetical protein